MAPLRGYISQVFYGRRNKITSHLQKTPEEMEAITAFLVVSVAHSLVLSASCPSISDRLSFTSTSANLTLPVNKTSLVNTKELSANFTASGPYGAGEVQTEIYNFGGLFHFDSKADVDAAIGAATLDVLCHSDGEMMPEVAYHGGPGGGKGVVLKLEPIHQRTADMTWGMWGSVLMEITKYFDREGLTPIDFSVRLVTEQTKLLIGDGSFVHDLWQEGDKGLAMGEMK